MTPTRWKGQGEQKHRWSEGGSSGSAKFGSRDSGKLSLAQDRGRPPTASLKTSSYLDPELKDDGTSPVKTLGKAVERLGKPKVLDYEEVEDGGVQYKEE